MANATRPMRTGGPATGARASWRAVALPAEHGGWGLTAEPVLLGILVAPSAAGVAIAAAALLAFLCRTPLKLAAVDRRRHHRLARTVLAQRIAAAELVVIAALVGIAASTARGAFWVPVLVAAPLFLLELYFDARSRGRRLVPELAGAVGISSTAAMILLADGGGGPLAAALWLVLTARALASIPFVRAQIARRHGRPASGAGVAPWDAAALAAGTGAVLLDTRVLGGALVVVCIVAAQLPAWRRPVPKIAIVGVQQMVLGLAVVAATAIGVLAF
jgi:hypothetical protein